MANPQKENGYIEIATEIIESLARTYLSSYETQVILAIFRKTYGWQKKEDWITNTQISEITGIASSHVSRTMKKLIKRKIIIKNGKKISFQKDYDIWGRLPKQVINKKLPIQDKKLPKQVIKVTQMGQENTQTGIHNRYYTKDTTTIDTIQKKLSKPSFDKEGVVYQLVIYLDGKIRENNEAENRKSKKTEPQIQSWCLDMDLLIRKDKADPDEVKKIIDWVVEDDFWSSNIMSAKKLRKHYPRIYKKAIKNTKSIKQMAEEDSFDWGRAIGEGGENND